ncbi:hypothetical protein BGX30_005706, partial [Mortierella sp. GBA39]
RIIAVMPKRKQTLFFSATMPPEISGLIQTLLVNPVKVEVTPVSSTAERIEQSVYLLAAGSKLQMLNQLLQDPSIESALTYVHRIGRTGRAGMSGTAISFCEADELPYLKDIEKLIGKAIPEVKGHDYPMEPQAAAANRPLGNSSANRPGKAQAGHSRKPQAGDARKGRTDDGQQRGKPKQDRAPKAAVSGARKPDRNANSSLKRDAGGHSKGHANDKSKGHGNGNSNGRTNRRPKPSGADPRNKTFYALTADDL